ncbi:MAG: metal-dependent hydrolase [Alkalispirochaetaceae bacterium]
MALKITFLGHSAFLLSDGKESMVIDPFLSGSPVAAAKPDEIKVEYVALTHGHADHFGDTIEILKHNDGTFIGAFEMANYVGEQGIEKVEPGNPGGTISTSFGSVTFTHAFHSSSYEGRYMGMPCGLIVEMGGKRFYHLGDTGLFGDLKLYGELYRPDVAAIPIGDRFTMGPELGSKAAEMVGAPLAIPIHYKTMPVLVQDASRFVPEGVAVKELEPGESITVE